MNRRKKLQTTKIYEVVSECTIPYEYASYHEGMYAVKEDAEKRAYRLNLRYNQNDESYEAVVIERDVYGMEKLIKNWKPK